MSRGTNTWLKEYVTPHVVQEYRVSGILHSARSRYQQIEVLESPAHGLTLVLDGKTQSAEIDEFIFHEALVHPAMITHPSPERVFIAGGGEGATLREVLSHSTVKRAVMVDIDREVIEISKKYLQHWHRGSFDDPRTELFHQDARQYLKDNTEAFDVIIIDLADPVEGNPSALLYTREFYQLALERLTTEGVMVVQSELANHGATEAFTAICNTVGSVFRRMYPYRTCVPAFGGDWGFSIGTRLQDPTRISIQEIDQAVAERITRPLRFYDGLTHQGLFALPKQLRELIKAETKVITETEPLVVV